MDSAAPPVTLRPASPASSPAAAIPVLSPSRASDFKRCPLLYRFRAIDRLPEPPSPAAVRGTLVHAVLDALFDLPAQERTVVQARGLAASQWQRLLELEPTLAEVLAGDDATADRWLADAGDLLERYFALEDPTRLEPAGRELLLEVDLGDGLRLKGVLDRLDESAGGDLRVVDYKSGRAPHPLVEQNALFQLRFYALMLWRSRGRVPLQLQLVYLADGQLVRLQPDEADLQALERTLRALATAVARATSTGDFRPRRGPLCAWCPHQALCPEFGGTPPPIPRPEDAGAVPTT
jgi:putative RecB family exonuclease